MEIDEEKLSSQLMEIEYIRRELENYINALNNLQATQDNIARALDGLNSLKENSDVLIPYAQDIFIRGKVNELDNAIVGIGSNIFKSFSLKELKKKLESDFKEVSGNIGSIAQTIQVLQERGTKLEEEANKLYESYQNSLR
ncbi:MAG: prefoldin subunit alpha [Candidatus Parvarchaeota archaeon]|jgi:prefoldin alpha subunit|nr:prefoldin subunit alpha [Candidatus Parvarchaeota archaeon]MCL5107147.1 prefoldin subunit alpha [Candidatus Parvarchaeota archaeon]